MSLTPFLKAGQADRADAAFDEVEIAHLRAWMNLSDGAKIDFFEEMIELAYRSGALRPDRLALRD